MNDYCCLFAKQAKKELNISLSDPFITSLSFNCSLCNDNNFHAHEENDYYKGMSYECFTCKQYIVYYDKNIIYKEDFIYSKYDLIIDYDDNTISFVEKDLIIIVPYFYFNPKEPEKAVEKIKKLSIFR